MYNYRKFNTKEGFFMDKIIKEIEDMSLNAWPSHKMELYDGWILRFSYFYTHRTNSVEQFGTSTLSWREKVSFCETEYARLDSPAIFKISPLVSPDFDYLLENANVVGTPGSGFGPSGETYFRLTAFGSYENTVEAIRRIQAL